MQRQRGTGTQEAGRQRGREVERVNGGEVETHTGCTGGAIDVVLSASGTSSSILKLSF